MTPPADIREYGFTLFVSGASDASAHAIEHAREICEEHLRGRYELSIVDLHQQPELPAGQRVLATPTLVRDRPLPRRVVVGDMSDPERILTALDVPAGAAPAGGHRDQQTPHDGQP